MKQKFKSLITGTLTAVLVLALFSCKSPTSDKPEATNFVTYKANGATSGTVPIDETDYATGGSIIILDNTGKLDRSGYSFEGWNTKADGTGTTYSPGQSFSVPDKAVTLFALWKPFVPFTLSFDANGAESGSAPATQTYAGGSSQSLPGNTDNLVKTGYGLVGWNTAKNGSGTFYATGAAFVMPAADTTLYAVWNTYFTYTLSGTNATITGFSAAWDGKTDIIIPSSIAGNMVVAIAANAFRDKTTLTSFVIPDTVTGLGDSAFNGCTNLISIDLGHSITKINDHTFRSCEKLTSIVIPGSVTTIGDLALSYCKALTSVTLENGVTTIGMLVFYDSPLLTSLTFPASVTTISQDFTNFCTGITALNVNAANTVYASDNGILYNKAKTRLIKCPSGKTGTITIPSGVTEVAYGAFSGDHLLTGVNLPSSVVTIGEAAFYNCSGLTSLSIPSNVTSIGRSAFKACYKLTTLNIPALVTTIGGTPFEECSLLASITVDSGNTAYVAESGVLFNKAKTVLVAYPASKTDASYAIPATVQTIEQSALYESKFTSVTIPSSVTSIGYGAFNSSRLTSVTIPGTVTSIGNYAFSGCVSLTAITVQATTPPSSGYDVFRNSTCNISVPAASLAAYKAATNWSSYKTRIVGY